jgi:hypothetical protein
VSELESEFIAARLYLLLVQRSKPNEPLRTAVNQELAEVDEYYLAGVSRIRLVCGSDA